jgi:hypothetical protein
MAIPAVVEYHVERFWDDEFKNIDYIHEPFNDPATVETWVAAGYPDKFCGGLADMRHELPTWAGKFIEIYENLGWHDVGIAFYCMPTGTVMPVHRDLYKKYIEVFKLQGQEHNIRRALLLLEDWKPGHYLEVNDKPYVNWMAGKTVEWYYNTAHMAANIGLEPRYSLQITGHL